MNQYETLHTPYYSTSINKKKMKLRLTATAITLSSQPDLGMFSHHRGPCKINFCAALCVYHLALCKAVELLLGRKDDTQKILKDLLKSY